MSKTLRVDQIRQRGGAVSGLGVLPTATPLSANPQFEIPQFSTQGFDAGQLESMRILNQIAQAEAQEYRKELLSAKEEESLLKLNTKFNIEVHNDRQRAILDQVADEYDISAADYHALDTGNAIAVKDWRHRHSKAAGDRRYLDVVGEVSVAQQLYDTNMKLLGNDDEGKWAFFNEGWTPYLTQKAGDKNPYDLGMLRGDLYRTKKQPASQFKPPTEDAMFTAEYQAAQGDPMAQAYLKWKAAQPATTADTYLETYFGDNPTGEESRILTAARQAAREGRLDPNNPDEVLPFVNKEYAKLDKPTGGGGSGGGSGTQEERDREIFITDHIEENDLTNDAATRRKIRGSIVAGRIKMPTSAKNEDAIGTLYTSEESKFYARGLAEKGIDVTDRRVEEEIRQKVALPGSDPWTPAKIEEIILMLNPPPPVLTPQEELEAAVERGRQIVIPTPTPQPTSPPPAAVDTPRIDLRRHLPKQ